MQKKKWTFATTAIVAGLIALSAIATLVIRIPIPATTGYFNIGDVFVVLAGLWLGPLAGALVGGLGPTIADAIGFPIFIPATLVTKGMEGFLVGLIASRARGSALKLRTIAAFAGGLTVAVGYFVFEAKLSSICRFSSRWDRPDARPQSGSDLRPKPAEAITNSPFNRVPIEVTVSVGKARPLIKDLIALDKHQTAKSARSNPAAAVTHAKLIPPGTT